jgi:hypothetical protein
LDDEVDVFVGGFVGFGVVGHGEEGPCVGPGGVPVTAWGAFGEEFGEGGFALGGVWLDGGPGEEFEGVRVLGGHPVTGGRV